MKRRSFLRQSSSGLLLPAFATAKSTPPAASLAGEIGVTTGSFMKHLSPTAQSGKLRLLDLPKIMRDELGMRVIDLMTATLASFEPAYLDQLRAAAADAGCILTNLKMNQPGLDLGSEDPAVRRHAVNTYKRTIDDAARLGVRWVRPLPLKQRPDLQAYVSSYHELMDHAGFKNIRVLVENFGWMQDDPDALPRLITAIGRDIAAQPDTGNWKDNTVRYAGLAKAFPFAVSCDFKARPLAPDGSHPEYDLRRCHDIGWDAGFRGPWCIEHFGADLRTLLAGIATLRDNLRTWTRDKARP